MLSGFHKSNDRNIKWSFKECSDLIVRCDKKIAKKNGLSMNRGSISSVLFEPLFHMRKIKPDEYLDDKYSDLHEELVSALECVWKYCGRNKQTGHMRATTFREKLLDLFVCLKKMKKYYIRLRKRLK
jgi:hypothetical protein